MILNFLFQGNNCNWFNYWRKFYVYSFFGNYYCCICIFWGILYDVKNIQNYNEEKNKYKDIKNQLFKDLNIKDIIIFEIKKY